MGVPLGEAHRIGRRPLDRPLQAGNLGAQTQRVGCETPMQERFTRSPGWPFSEATGGQGHWLGEAQRAPRPSTWSDASPVLSCHPGPSHIHLTLLSPLPPASVFPPPLQLYWDGLPPGSPWALDSSSSGSSCRTRVMAGMWWEEEGSESAEETGGKSKGGGGGDRESGGTDKGWGRGHQLPRSLWESSEASSQPLTSAHLKCTLGSFTQALVQSSNLAA